MYGLGYAAGPNLYAYVDNDLLRAFSVHCGSYPQALK